MFNPQGQRLLDSQPAGAFYLAENRPHVRHYNHVPACGAICGAICGGLHQFLHTLHSHGRTRHPNPRPSERGVLHGFVQKSRDCWGWDLAICSCDLPSQTPKWISRNRESSGKSVCVVRNAALVARARDNPKTR